MAPIAVGKAMMDGGTIPADWIDPNSGRAKTTPLKTVSLCRALMPRHLDLKVSKHIRNAVSHGHVRVLAGDKVEVNDFDAQGRRTFGPKVFARAELQAFVDEWGIKMGACLAALCLFDINNHGSLVQRCPPALPTEPMREDLEKQILTLAASGIGLTYLSHENTSGCIEVRVKIAERNIHGSEEITWVGDQFTTRQEWTPKRDALQLDSALIRLGESTLDVILSYDTSRFVVVGGQPSEILGRATFTKAAAMALASDPAANLTPLEIEVGPHAVEITTLVPGRVSRSITPPENRMRRRR